MTIRYQRRSVFLLLSAPLWLHLLHTMSIDGEYGLATFSFLGCTLYVTFVTREHEPGKRPMPRFKTWQLGAIGILLSAPLWLYFATIMPWNGLDYVAWFSFLASFGYGIYITRERGPALDRDRN